MERIRNILEKNIKNRYIQYDKILKTPVNLRLPKIKIDTWTYRLVLSVIPFNEHYYRLEDLRFLHKNYKGENTIKIRKRKEKSMITINVYQYEKIRDLYLDQLEDMRKLRLIND
jgi:hypothetical protein